MISCFFLAISFDLFSVFIQSSAKVSKYYDKLKHFIPLVNIISIL